MSELRVKKMEHVVPVNVLERDDDGRPTSVQCPCCHEPAAVREDGKIVCDFQDAMTKFLQAAFDE